MDPVPFSVAGRPASSTDVLDVRHPYDGRVIGRTSNAAPDQVEAAVAAAVGVADRVAALPAHVRAAALDHVSNRLAQRAEELAFLITGESGKPLRWARAEVARAVSTFRWAAEEARRFSGDLQRLDTDPSGTGRLALIRRMPRGPVLGITPFHFPLSLVAQKVAPALAVGAPIVVKPASSAPLAALALGQILAETELPSGMFSVLPLSNDRAAQLVRDPRLPVVSFTGRGAVGAAIRHAVPEKHLTLELGGNAAALICSDWASDEDFTWAAQRIATFANYQAGQSCTAVQRVYVQEWLYDGFLARLVAAVAALRTGDPFEEETDVGPLISEDAAQRVEAWVAEAVAAGGSVAVGGERDGASYLPTVLTGVPAGSRVWTEEMFGPVLAVAPVLDDAAGFAAINDSPYGLQAGVFTHSLQTAFAAHRTLRVGGVIVGDVPTYRADQMPYGGVKGSGIGRAGVRSAMDDYTESRVMVLSGIDV
ncbi:MAG TPA: aldehyde dehydrogenase family protein [Micromonosporaceae bacterium]|nr:aldehyde dehydrogenase family protein [Micromonosporaceae bacterium]